MKPLIISESHQEPPTDQKHEALTLALGEAFEDDTEDYSGWETPWEEEDWDDYFPLADVPQERYNILAEPCPDDAACSLTFINNYLQM